LVGAAAFTLSASLSLLGCLPQPRIHDEFSNLLAADTFAHGRLTNPTHPFWIHFESPHILQRPSYASKYPPGQGLFLALGQVLAGQPITGVWLSTALACAAVCWMLRAWLPPRWAVLGGFLAVLHPTMVLWSQCYWGGALAVCGGALLLGALRRILREPRPRDGFLLGVGLALLAVSRPFEGLALGLLAGVCFFAWRGSGFSSKLARSGRLTQYSVLSTQYSVLGVPSSELRRHPKLRRVLVTTGLPFLLVIVCTAAALGYYHARVTGHPLRLPYQVHDETYAAARPFWWLPPRPEPAYRHQELRDLHVGWELPSHEAQRSLAGLWQGCLSKAAVLFQGYFPYALFQLPLLALPWLYRHTWTRRGLTLLGLFAVVLLSETWMHPHYAAPAAGLVFLLIVQGLRAVRLWRWRGRAVGCWLVWACFALFLASLPSYCTALTRLPCTGWHAARARLLAELRQTGGRHVIFVRYQPGHSPHDEWVYNEADIDQAPVVWARELDAAQNQRLVEYFHDRRAWVLEADQPMPRLTPYSQATTQR
jgi:hypothetical protein